MPDSILQTEERRGSTVSSHCFSVCISSQIATRNERKTILNILVDSAHVAQYYLFVPYTARVEREQGNENERTSFHGNLPKLHCCEARRWLLETSTMIKARIQCKEAICFQSITKQAMVS